MATRPMKSFHKLTKEKFTLILRVTDDESYSPNFAKLFSTFNKKVTRSTSEKQKRIGIHFFTFKEETK